MELKDYLVILWRRKWVIAVTTLVTVSVVVIGTLMATPQYTASAVLRVLTIAGGSVDWVQYNVQYAERLMNTYAEIATSGPVLEELMQRLALDEPPQIAVEVMANTELMEVTAAGPNPMLAQEAANALAEILVAQSAELYTGGAKSAQEILGEQLAQIEEELNKARREYESLVAQSPGDSERIMAAGRSITLKEETYATLLEQYERVRVSEALRANTLSVVEPAAIPRTPSTPRKKMNFVLGFVVGLAGGVGLAFLFEYLDTRLYTAEQVEEATALPTVGRIPKVSVHRHSAFLDGNSRQGEAFRRLRTNIFALGDSTPLQTLLVTSSEPQEGKTTIVASLAYAIAEAGHQVVAVDCDLRHPTLHSILSLTNEIGLSSVLQQQATLDEAIHLTQIPGLHVLTAGPSPSKPAELIGSHEMGDLVQALRLRFGLVLFDTPALAAVADAAVLAPMADGVLLVVSRGQAREEAVRAACQQLADVKAASVGVVVNRVERDGGYAYYQYTPNRRG